MSRPARSRSRGPVAALNDRDDTLARPSLPRVTPRNSTIGASVAAAAKATPYADVSRNINKYMIPSYRNTDARAAQLRDLAGLMRAPATPARRPSPAAPTPNAGPNTNVATTTGRRNRPRPTRPTTPHALRALQQRRNAALNTPGRERRRSGRQQRDTPHDALRNLSRRKLLSIRLWAR